MSWQVLHSFFPRRYISCDLVDPFDLFDLFDQLFLDVLTWNENVIVLIPMTLYLLYNSIQYRVLQCLTILFDPYKTI